MVMYAIYGKHRLLSINKDISFDFTFTLQLNNSLEQRPFKH